MNFETLQLICALYFVSFFILLGVIATVPGLTRGVRIVAGVATCLSVIVIGTVFTIWFYNNAPETAYINHVMQEQEKGTP